MGEFYSVAVTNNHQQADTGTKMMHIGKNTEAALYQKEFRQVIQQNSYRGLVQVSETRRQCPKFFTMRFIVDGRQMRCAYFPLHRSKK